MDYQASYNRKKIHTGSRGSAYELGVNYVDNRNCMGDPDFIVASSIGVVN